MSWDDLSARFKNIETEDPDASGIQLEPGEATMLRGRITGVLIRDARVAKGYTVQQMAELLQVRWRARRRLGIWHCTTQPTSVGTAGLLAGSAGQSLHFRNRDDGSAGGAPCDQSAPNTHAIRNRMIGTQIREARMTMLDSRWRIWQSRQTSNPRNAARLRVRSDQIFPSRI